MKIKELRDKNKEELTKMLAEKRDHIRSVRFDIAAKQVKNNREIRNDKRDTAKILTLLGESDK